MKNKKSKLRKATLLLAYKEILSRGHIIEVKIWRLTSSEEYPMGIKYRMVLLKPGTLEVILLYDNHWPKGPHMHYSEMERPYLFKNMETLLKDFLLECKVEIEKHYEN